VTLVSVFLRAGWFFPVHQGDTHASSPFQGGPINTAFHSIRKPIRQAGFLLLCGLTGVIAGLGAVFFRALIALAHNALYYGRLSTVYDANVHAAASTWGPFIILVPVLGSLGVTFLVTQFAPEAKGHGVPEVMEAVYYAKGRIRPVVAVFKSLASALSIGSGGSVGREGPIAQIGSAFGSTMGQLLTMTTKQRVTLIAAGAGGGIAATFNTPIGGILFAVELLLQEVSVATLVPVAVTTITATYMGQLFFGVHPSFVIPALQQPYFHPLNPWLLGPYAALGVLMGLASAVYIHSLYLAEDFFEKRTVDNPYLRHAVGMLAMGGLMYGLMAVTGRYYVDGVGYSTVQDILTGNIRTVHLLVLLFFLKLLATGLTLGSGGSGGIFSPSLFLGATAGGAFGIVLQHVLPHAPVSPAAFAVAGMAGMVGGATGAAMTAIVMIFEMTLDYSVILPMTITVALSYGTRTLLLRESIYTMKLARRDHYIPPALQANLLHVRRARDIMQTPVVTILSSDSLDVLALRSAENPDVRWFLVAEGGQVTGVASRDYALSASETERRGWHSVVDVMRRDFILARENETMDSIVARMHRPHSEAAVVLRRPGSPPYAVDVTGIITWERVAELLEEAVELFSEGRE
jgi:CIC family chloride channel protein